MPEKFKQLRKRLHITLDDLRKTGVIFKGDKKKARYFCQNCGAKYYKNSNDGKCVMPDPKSATPSKELEGWYESCFGDLVAKAVPRA